MMLDSDEFRRWRQAADEAMASARTSRNGGHAAWACFQCEQAAQLAVKGLLHGLGEAAWGHDLTDLVQRAQQSVDAQLPEDVAAGATRLSRHYIPARYPDAYAAGTPAGHYTKDDADSALQDAQRLVSRVDAWWQALEEADDQDAAADATADDGDGEEQVP